MGITAIRTDLAAILKDVPGINAALPYPPDKVTVNNTAWLDFNDEEIQMSQRELTLHTLPLFVVVGRKSDVGKELAATEPLIEAVKAALRSKQRLLTAAVDRVQYTRVRQVIAKVGDVEHIGFQMTLQIKESRGVTLSG